MSFLLINEHGEIIDETKEGRYVKLDKGDRVVRRKSLEYLKNRGKYSKTDRRYINILADVFTKVNLEEFKLILIELNVYEKAFLLSIIPYVGYEDCVLKRRNGAVLDIDDFVKLSGISRAKIYEVIFSLGNKYIIYKKKVNKKTKYYINPWLFSRGDKLDENLKEMFGKYEIRCRSMKTWNNL